MIPKYRPHDTEPSDEGSFIDINSIARGNESSQGGDTQSGLDDWAQNQLEKEASYSNHVEHLGENHTREKRPCERKGCKKLGTKLCPACTKLRLNPSHFCSQACFAKAWNIHKLVHVYNVIEPNEIEKEDAWTDGSFGKVSKGIYKGKLVVIKRCHRKSDNFNDFYVRALGFLKKAPPHENVTKLIGVMSPPDNALVTEYIKGFSLMTLLGNPNQHFNSRKIIKILWQICSGMKYLHDLKIVHLNLSTHNVKMERGIIVKLTDYGLIGVVDQERARWKAPEYLSSGEGSLKSDVWAFGIVICEMLSRDYPYRGVDNEAVVEVIVKKKQLPEIPDESLPSLKQLMRYCLSYNAAQRPSFDIVRNFLTALLKEQ